MVDTSKLNKLIDLAQLGSVQSIHFEGETHRVVTEEGHPIALIQWGTKQPGITADLIAAALNMLPLLLDTYIKATAETAQESCD